ncbi:DUF1294 domain-containing protein [Marinomonas flavescens]|uniref:DUF1294 domain-containing protein n=1 Tax=Marinomonas flavescens TaxID=2529379 RepID=UPI0010566ECF|nr:DUF1294 domain-containing protein [Marinomonas flavescens]
MSYPVFLVSLYVVFSIVAFGFYGWDKRAAKKSRRRVPEVTLHWLALLGGWPGAILAQKYFRHKTIKKSFRIAFWLTCVANILLLMLACFFVQVGFVQGISNIQALLNSLYK